MIAGIPQNMSLPNIEPVQECRYEARGYNLNCALPFQGKKKHERSIISTDGMHAAGLRSGQEPLVASGFRAQAV